MTDPTPPGAHSAFRVLAALADLGEATAADIAQHAGLGYSTTTPKLRTWEHTGQVERSRTDDGHTLWRLTAAGRAATATTHSQRDPADAVSAAAADDRRNAADTAALARAATDTGTPADAADEPGAIPDAGSRPGTTPTLSDDAPHAHPLAPGDPQDGPTDSRTGPPADEAGGAPTGSGTQAGPTAGDAASAIVRRPAGSMRAAILDVCEADPERAFKVGELCKLIDAANAGTGTKNASQGAVYNACTKLAAAGTLTQTVDRPATFQLTRAGN